MPSANCQTDQRPSYETLNYFSKEDHPVTAQIPSSCIKLTLPTWRDGNISSLNKLQPP